MSASCLLLDSGATKTQWVYLREGHEEATGALPGLHPFLTPASVWRESLSKLPRAGGGQLVGEICFYGTGCGSAQGCERVSAYFQEFYCPGLAPIVESDLLAAARSLCGHSPGIVGILGTGSNLARYDGQQMVEQFGGFGYVLGDEGSGASLGKAFLRAYLYRKLPQEIDHYLETEKGLSRTAIIDAVYNGGAPSRYLASWAADVLLWSADHFVENLIQGVFQEFVQLNVLPLVTADQRVLHCTGSIAVHFRTWLEAALAAENLVLGQVSQAPMSGLIHFHNSL